MPNLERFIEDIQKRLPGLDFEGKRLALEMLNITVWVDGEAVEITGTIEPEYGIVTTHSSLRSHNTILPFSLKISPMTSKQDSVQGLNTNDFDGCGRGGRAESNST